MCVATGKSVAEVHARGLEFHLEGMTIDGNPTPPPTTVATAIAEMQS